jgi:hypothetical protein
MQDKEPSLVHEDGEAPTEQEDANSVFRHAGPRLKGDLATIEDMKRTEVICMDKEVPRSCLPVRSAANRRGQRLGDVPVADDYIGFGVWLGGQQLGTLDV